MYTAGRQQFVDHGVRINGLSRYFPFPQRQISSSLNTEKLLPDRQTRHHFPVAIPPPVSYINTDGSKEGNSRDAGNVLKNKLPEQRGHTLYRT